MAFQLIGIDSKGNQNYECKSERRSDIHAIANSILEGMQHVEQVIAIENIPNISQIEDAYHISYRSKFCFIVNRNNQNLDTQI